MDKKIPLTTPCKDNKRKISYGLSRSKRISEPFISPLLTRQEAKERESDNQICKRIKFDSSFSAGGKDESHHATVQEQCSIELDKNDCLSSNSAPIEIKNFHMLLAEKQETLRKLNMVKMYRKKNNLNELQDLIDKWRKVSQDAATRLLDSINTDKTVTMGQLLDQLQINHELIRYSEDEDGFLSS